jgi:hypothetical protein
LAHHVAHLYGTHGTAKTYLDAQFTYERENEGGSRGLRVLASSCPQNRVYYAAAQVMTNGVGGDVFAIVCLVQWNPPAGPMSIAVIRT